MSDNAKKGFLPEKYAKGYKGAEDWLSEMITNEVTTKGKSTGKRGPIAVTALFDLARANDIDVSKHVPNQNVAGFAGRFRMTLRNMLQATTKRRHGLFGCDNKWHNAPPDWLTSKGAPDKPVEKRNGEKIAKAKTEKSAVTVAAAKPKKSAKKPAKSDVPVEPAPK